MNEQYLTILQDGLRKKVDILDEILRISQCQNEILSEESIDFARFDQCVDDKDICIKQLNDLDEGFETLYERVRAELQGHKAAHAAWIEQTKKLISEVMEKSVAIQAKEERNKQAVEAAFRKERQEYGQGKRSVQAAMNYYRNMNNTNVVPPQFMDSKK